MNDLTRNHKKINDKEIFALFLTNNMLMKLFANYFEFSNTIVGYASMNCTETQKRFPTHNSLSEKNFKCIFKHICVVLIIMK